MKANLLVSVPNWLGDGIMSMPVFPWLKRQEPNRRISVLLKPSMEALWTMCPGVDNILSVEEGGLRASMAAAQRLKAGAFDEVLIFPNSFRSAFVPWLAGIPSRIGMAGHHRSWMLTRIVPRVEDSRKRHQSWEYIQIAGLSEKVTEIEMPRLAISNNAVSEMANRLGIAAGGRRVGIVPGAARGPSKQWPVEYFAETAKALVGRGCSVLVLGTAKESLLCAQVAGASGAVNLAGKTSVPELAAVLSTCRVVVCNDSGGMHLAAAAGARVVAVYGMTDPSRTGPLGKGHAVILNEDVAHSRDIARDSEEAKRALEAIPAERVIAAAVKILEES